jgi:hypothetical protein
MAFAFAMKVEVQLAVKGVKLVHQLGRRYLDLERRYLQLRLLRS